MGEACCLQHSMAGKLPPLELKVHHPGAVAGMLTPVGGLGLHNFSFLKIFNFPLTILG